MRVALRVIGLAALVGAALWLTAACNEGESEPDAVHAGQAVLAESASAPLSYRPTLTDPQAQVDPSPDPTLALPATNDPLLPDIRILEPSSPYLVDQRPSGDRRLKFTTTIWNAGPGPIEVRGHEDPASGRLAVQQVLHTADGGTVPGDLVGRFQFEHRHGHLHLAGFARYELWSVGENWELDEIVAKNEKVGFCLMDNIVVDEGLIAPDAEPVYPIDCGADVQGISPGYGDVYVAQLYEQDIVITDLEDGRYALVNVANPEHSILEADYGNNVETTYLTLDGRLVIRR